MPYHLVVLVHGVWGNPSHMSYLARQVLLHCKPKDPDEELVVLVTGSHAGYLTYDGVDVNGKRISKEIRDRADQLLQSGTIAKFSLIGYSMGGLISRYALGILYNEGFFDKITPYHFVTFSTPHVGSHNPSGSLSSKVYNCIAPHVLARTGKHMFLTDSDSGERDTNQPLLRWMADPASKFYKALAAFEHRTLYCNTINDRRTSFYTTSISNADPFHSMVNESLSAYKLNYVDGYSPTVIDYSRPIEFKKVIRENPGNISILRILFKVLRWTKLIAYAAVFAPFYSLFALARAIRERIKSDRRMSSFARDSADSLKALYDKVTDTSPEQDFEQSNFSELVNDETEKFVDSIYDALNSASYYDYHHSITRAGSSNSVEKVKPEDLDTTKVVDLKGKPKSDFKVRLIPDQEIIIAQLNKLSWTKYPVIIRDTKATHAAIIYRHPDPGFDEGMVVVDHFVKHVFKI